VAAVRLPRISNGTDVDALACEPGVVVRYVTEPSRLADADLVVLPGSKSTVADLSWLRQTGLAAAVAEHAGAGRPVLGICGGYQMLGRRVIDNVESGAGEVAGLGLLDLEVVFDAVKHLGRPSGTAFGVPVTGYEIHHGRVMHRGDPALVWGADEGSDGGHVWGTHWHGLLENDAFRRALLRRVACLAGRPVFQPAPDTNFAQLRSAQLNLLGDLVSTHLDTDALVDLINHGPPATLPFVPPGAIGGHRVGQTRLD
jgi:adenosylcobyric acid synthase